MDSFCLWLGRILACGAASALGLFLIACLSEWVLDKWVWHIRAHKAVRDFICYRSDFEKWLENHPDHRA